MNELLKLKNITATNTRIHFLLC